MKRTREARGGIQALDAALVVLRVLARAPGPVSLSEVAREAGMSARKFTATSRASRAPASSDRRSASACTISARRRSSSASRRSRASTSSSARRNGSRSCVEKTGAAALLAVWGTHGPTVVRWNPTASFVITALGLGTTLPLLSSATGHVFLAFSSPRVVGERLREERRRARALGLRWPDLDPSSDHSIRELRERVRRDGYATVDGRFIPGLYGASAPIRNGQGEPEAAITLASGDRRVLERDGGALETLLEVCAEVCPRSAR